MNKEMRWGNVRMKGLSMDMLMRRALKKTTDMDMKGDMGMLMRGDTGMLLKRSIGNGDSDGRLFCCGGNANSLRSQLLLNLACQSIVVIRLFICSYVFIKLS